MTANKMPEMPKWDTSCMECGWSLSEKGIADYGRACYLAGIADARACVPAQRFRDEYDEDIEWASVGGHNDCRNKTFANLKALEEGVAKGPALEQEAKK